MPKNTKKYLFILIICLFALLSINEKIVNADSGWDSSYDSGSSSWDSNSSWDSSSSWDSDDDWSSSDNYHSSGNASLSDIMIYGGMILLIMIILSLITNKANQISKIDTSKIPLKKGTIKEGLSYEEIKAIDPNLDKEILRSQAFEIYKKVQESWMNFDYNSLRNNLTDEMYNMYSSQLKTLKLKNQKNIMKDIIYKKCEIKSINIENGIEEINIYLNVSQYDYVIDKNEKVVRGTDKYKNNMEYIITLVRDIKKAKLENCPNCGAPIEIISGGACPYCESTIINNNKEFVMSKKECVGQWREK